MKHISIGTCVPGDRFEAWAPAFINAGFECLSVNFHMTLGDVDPVALAARVREILAGTRTRVAALGFYCNAIEYSDHEKTLHRMIDLAELFGTDTVSTFAGAYEGRSVDAAMGKYKQVFTEIAKHAEDKGVRVAIENCPMDGTWKSCTCNIGFNPRAWDMMFNEVPSRAIGLEWEPAHQMYQLIDPIANLRQYADRIYGIHGKDAEVRWDEIGRSGIMGKEDYVAFRLPGFGDTDWRKIFSILNFADYGGYVSIEGYHDPLFSGDMEFTGQLHAFNYLKWCRGGDYAPNPWDVRD